MDHPHEFVPKRHPSENKELRKRGFVLRLSSSCGSDPVFGLEGLGIAGSETRSVARAPSLVLDFWNRGALLLRLGRLLHFTGSLRFEIKGTNRLWARCVFRPRFFSFLKSLHSESRRVVRCVFFGEEGVHLDKEGPVLVVVAKETKQVMSRPPWKPHFWAVGSESGGRRPCPLLRPRKEKMMRPCRGVKWTLKFVPAVSGSDVPVHHPWSH